MYARSGVRVDVVRGFRHSGHMLGVKENHVLISVDFSQPIDQRGASWTDIDACKPYLRRTSGMTVDEMLEYAGSVGGGEPPAGENLVCRMHDGWFDIVADGGEGGFWTYSLTFLTPVQALWLLDNGFDLFDLIDSGEAIELKEEKP